MSTLTAAQQAKQASFLLASLASDKKNQALQNIARRLQKSRQEILQHNQKDEEAAKKNNLAPALLQRLVLTLSKIDEMIKGVSELVSFPEPVGKILSKTELDKGLVLSQVTCPLGVIGIIFEARPEVLIQIACLALKSGNAVILKGGKEALHSNRFFFQVLAEETASLLPQGWIQLLETRDEVKELLDLSEYVDLIIPRGSYQLVRHIQKNTAIPVLGHAEGLCHIYVDKDANLPMAEKIILDAKVQYPAVCNSVETILVHQDLAPRWLVSLINLLQYHKVKIKVDATSIPYYQLQGVSPATPQDWRTEYSDLIINIKIIPNIAQAITHINTYGSKHTDAIITDDQAAADTFFKQVDSSCVFWNCSTRFSDGYRFGKGAEVGISTGKIHARGPVGIEGLLIYKYLLEGHGQLVAQYSGAQARPFLHRREL